MTKIIAHNSSSLFSPHSCRFALLLLIALLVSPSFGFRIGTTNRETVVADNSPVEFSMEHPSNSDIQRTRSLTDRPSIQWMRNGNMNEHFVNHDSRFENTQRIPSISSILEADGSVIRGSMGSFDPTGYRMVNGENGKPRFVAADNRQLVDTCIDGWDERFKAEDNGFNGDVNTIAVSGTDVYVGGTFTTVVDSMTRGEITANRIAKWNGISWTPLSSGVNGAVTTISVDGTDIYVGGSFSTAGGVSANNIAKWDGSSWTALGIGRSGSVNAIAKAGGILYVGTSYDGVHPGISAWNGTSWTGVGNSAGIFAVNTIAVLGGSVYVGGLMYDVSGNPSIDGIAKWDGTSWSGIGWEGGPTAARTEVYSATASGSDLYVVGMFKYDTNGQYTEPYYFLRKWNGSSWSQILSRTPIAGHLNELPWRSLSISGGDMYVGGNFSGIGGVNATNIAKFDGTTWTALGTTYSIQTGPGLDGSVKAIAATEHGTYIGGTFTTAIQTIRGYSLSRRVSTNHIAKWDDEWSSVGSTGLGIAGGFGPLGTQIKAIAVAMSGDIYIGGNFSSVAGTNMSSIAKWNGHQWSDLVGGIAGYVNAIAVSGTDVYVGGQFSFAGDDLDPNTGTVAVNNIAKWDGARWRALDTGTNGVVNAIAISGNDVFVGGNFTVAGIRTAVGVARWDGFGWWALNPNFATAEVKAIAVTPQYVYFAGRFNGTHTLAAWNGSSWWVPSSGGVDYAINALAAQGNDVYVGGDFQTAGGIPANYIAKWNPSLGWSTLGNGVNKPVNAITVSGNDVYAGGNFETVGFPVNHIAKWNGSSWSAFDSGVNGNVFAVGVSGSDLYVGGSFTTAGCHPSNNFGHFSKKPVIFDFDGDGKTDASVYRPSNNVWYLQRSTAGFTAYQFGAAGDKMVPADYTGDGKTDVAMYRPSNGTWYILRSEDLTLSVAPFGISTDIPTPGDFDADGKADLAVYRADTQGTFYIQRSTEGFTAVQFGLAGDRPTTADFDGDGKADIAVYRPSTGVWYRFNSSNGAFWAAQFGAAGDKVVPADYTGDGKTDLAVYRPSTGFWYVLRSENDTAYGAPFGISTDIPAAGDYDGDGKADLAVYRPDAQGLFYILGSSAGFSVVPFGLAGDIPAPSAYVN